MTEGRSNPEIWFKLTINNTIIIFIYYCLLLVFGLIISLGILISHKFINGYSTTLQAIIGSIGFTLIGCTINYTRKLYKACINNDISFPNNSTDKIRQVGIMVYFIMRPLYSISFVLFAIIAIKAGVSIVTIKEVMLNENFIHLTMFLSFFIGYSSGDLVTYFDQNSATVAKNIFKRNIN